MTEIIRNERNARFSRTVVHGNTVYLTGVSTVQGDDIVAQTREVLRRIDGYLDAAGTDKSRLLQVLVWLKDIKRDFEGLNKVWTEWVPPEAVPARATCQAELADPKELVEIVVVAATR
jgi:enamine deaminase RidA (YjgF/YER057c/UK114 family)